jgi:hypothetical protein
MIELDTQLCRAMERSKARAESVSDLVFHSGVSIIIYKN